MQTITVKFDNLDYPFQVSEHPHQDELRCKLGVHYHGKMVATFTPDRGHVLHLCKNYGNLSQPLLHALADKIEQLHPYGFFSQN